MLDPANKEAHFKASCLLNAKGDYSRALSFLQHALILDEQTKAPEITDEYYEKLICEGYFPFLLCSNQSFFQL